MSTKTRQEPANKKMDAILIQEIQNSIKFKKKEDCSASKIEEADEE